MKARAKAHTNIALIKYWGKRNEALILPTNNSLSVTLDGFYTETTVELTNDLAADVFTLDGETVTGTPYNQVTNYLDLFRDVTNQPDIHAIVTSINHVPTAAGFASSASGFAALAAASAKAFSLDITDSELSRFMRRGSGSACRSVYGGFVEWEMGEKEDGSDSFALPIAPQDHWDIRVAAVVLDAQEKTVSSRVGMKKTVDTSLFYEGWLKGIPHDLREIKAGIQAKDFEKVGEIAEANCLKMHATTFGTFPPFTYWQDVTMKVMQEIWRLREAGIPAYFTIDAGPNVKVLYQPQDEVAILEKLGGLDCVRDIVVSKVGPGISYL